MEDRFKKELDILGERLQYTFTQVEKLNGFQEVEKKQNEEQPNHPGIVGRFNDGIDHLHNLSDKLQYINSDLEKLI